MWKMPQQLQNIQGSSFKIPRSYMKSAYVDFISEESPCQNTDALKHMTLWDMVPHDLVERYRLFLQDPTSIITVLKVY
jgi:hypothetical protein